MVDEDSEKGERRSVKATPLPPADASPKTEKEGGQEKGGLVGGYPICPLSPLPHKENLHKFSPPRVHPLSTFEERGDAPDGDGTLRGELPEGQLEEEERNAGQHDVQAVRDQEGA